MYIKSFIAYIRQEKRLSPHTLLAYQNDLEQFQSFLALSDETISLHQANHQAIRQWIAALSKGDLAATSIHRKISTLKSFYRFLQANGMVADNPAKNLRLPKAPKPLPVTHSSTELDQLLDTMITETNDFSSSRNALLLELLYGAGLRRSEVLGLQLHHVDRSGQHVRVLGKGNKERMVPVGEKVFESLDRYLVYRNDIQILPEATRYLFVTEKGARLYDKMVYLIVKNKLGQMTTRQKRSPHTLRHSYATHLCDAGADLNAVKSLLGHSSLAATQVYTHTSIEQLKKVYQQAHPKAQPPEAATP